MRYIVAEGQEFSYPADPESLGIIKNAGGRSQLSDEIRAKVKFKTVKEGEDCGDMPKSARELYLSRGWVIDCDEKLAQIVEPEPESEPISEKFWEDLGRPLEEVK